MLCARCHTENREGRRFCSKCAAPLAVVCASCGFTNDPGDEFCGGCAKPLGAATTPPPHSPESYTPKHLADRILTSRAALEGERKQITVLFADLKGSMELLADRDPEEARRLLDPVLELMMEAVHRYEGTVNQVLGDGIMALFGAPIAHEDHARRACYAALRMQEAARRYAEQVRRTAGVPIYIRVGLNSGEVVVRSIGSDLRMDYTAVGQTTHLAARMEQAAMPGSILITPDTLRHVEGFVHVRALGSIAVKGLADAVEAYEVTGAGTVRTRLQAAVARGLTRFVGRDEEMEQLRRAMGHARDGHGNVVAVVGEAGVGKSRLFYELTHSHRLQDWLVLEASSVSYGKATSYLPLIDLLRVYFRIEDRDDDRSRREKVMGKLLALDDALRPALAPVLSLLDVAVEDAGWAALDPIERRQQIRESIRRLLMRESRVQPVAVVFEDLHWIDAETQAVLDNLVESLAGARMLLLVNYRPEYRDAWVGKSFYRLLRIDPLPAASVEELLRPLLGDDPALDGLKRLLAARTEGNPLFLEESVRTLVETGALVGERGSYRLAREAGALHVPATVQAILAARIDRLGAEDKALLQAAAVLGHDVPYALLEPIAGLPPDALATALRRLQAAEFLYEARLFPDLEYTFKHALTHEVAYESLLHERRRALHERIVDTLERLYSDRVSEHVEQLAHHAFRGGLWTKAVTYLSDAGAKALRSSANVAARGLLEQALTAFGRLATDQQTPDRAFELYLRLRHALLQLGEFDRMLEVLRDARCIAEGAGDERRVGWTLAQMGEALRADARYPEALDTAGRALAIARRCDDVLLEHQARFHLGSAYLALGDFGRATEVLEPNGRRSAIELFLSGDLTAPIPASIGLRGAAFAQVGDFANGLTLAEQSAQLGAQSGRPLHQVTGWAWAGAVYLQHGDYERALVFYERATDLARRYDIFFLLDRVTIGLACALAMAGRADEARVILRDGRQSYGGSWQPTLTEVVRAEAYLHAGQVQDAREAAQRAFALARDRGERPSEARARVAIGRAALSGSGDEMEAESHYREALAIAGDLGQRQLEAHVHLDLGTLRRRQGKLDEARAHLTAATTKFSEMGMTYWVEKTLERMNELS